MSKAKLLLILLIIIVVAGAVVLFLTRPQPPREPSGEQLAFEAGIQQILVANCQTNTGSPEAECREQFTSVFAAERQDLNTCWEQHATNFILHWYCLVERGVISPDIPAPS